MIMLSALITLPLAGMEKRPNQRNFSLFCREGAMKTMNFRKR
jgi:hypothetical protein